MIKQVNTKEFAEIKGCSVNYVRNQLERLTLLTGVLDTTMFGKDITQRRIDSRLKWLGPEYVSHEKISGVYVITIDESKI